MVSIRQWLQEGIVSSARELASRSRMYSTPVWKRLQLGMILGVGCIAPLSGNGYSKVWRMDINSIGTKIWGWWTFHYFIPQHFTPLQFRISFKLMGYSKGTVSN